MKREEFSAKNTLFSANQQMLHDNWTNVIHKSPIVLIRKRIGRKRMNKDEPCVKRVCPISDPYLTFNSEFFF